MDGVRGCRFDDDSARRLGKERTGRRRFGREFDGRPGVADEFRQRHRQTAVADVVRRERRLVGRDVGDRVDQCRRCVGNRGEAVGAAELCEILRAAETAVGVADDEQRPFAV